MGDVRYLKDYSDSAEPRPREIRFYGSMFRDESGNARSVSICVRVENGDVAGILSTVVEKGGIGGVHDDGVFRFVPWPCAGVEVRDV